MLKNNMLRSLIEKLIRNLKRDSLYELDKSYSMKQLTFILWYRFAQLVRGFFLKMRIYSSGIVFCGRRVVVEHGYQLRVGRNLIIEDNVYINALSQNGISVGNNVTIAKFSVLSSTGVIARKGTGIWIGNNSAIGAQSFLGGQGGISIGNDVIMGPQVKIFSENHNYNMSGVLIREQGESRKGVSIGNNCWIGAGVIILDGVAIADGCVIAGGSVITKSVDRNSIVAGVPGKVMGTRN